MLSLSPYVFVRVHTSVHNLPVLCSSLTTQPSGWFRGSRIRYIKVKSCTPAEFLIELTIQITFQQITLHICENEEDLIDHNNPILVC